MTTDQSPPVPAKRSGFQFSIKALLGLVAFVALGCAALLNASQWWASGMFALTIALLLAAILGSVFRRGRSRAFWLGFAICGWVHVLLVLGPPLQREISFRWQRDVQSQLLSTRLSEWAYVNLLPLVRTPPGPPPEPQPVVPNQGYSDSNVGTVSLVIDKFSDVRTVTPKTFYPEYTPFLMVAHWLWTLVVALLGGLLACYLYATRERKP